MDDDRQPVNIRVIHGDVLTFQTDVLVLKHAGGLHGVERSVMQVLTNGGVARMPGPGESCLVSGDGAIGARQILFVGVAPLTNFDYAHIRTFSHDALKALTSRSPHAVEVAYTLHGAGYGLDEDECFRAELAGLMDAAQSGDYPASLRVITIVERNAGRADRLMKLLEKTVPDRQLGTASHPATWQRRDAISTELGSVGFDSHEKPYAFVAMPINDETDDLFHYGIRSAVRACGLLCERIDMTPAIGDIVSRIKTRIAEATLVVAELSGENPNVYLEVGYAWGKGIPTVLLVQNDHLAELSFDVRGQRCVLYSRIQDLESRLTDELQDLTPRLPHPEHSTPS